MKRDARSSSPPRSASPPSKRAGVGKASKPTGDRSRAKSLAAASSAALKDGTYAERTIWSGRFKAWSRYHVKKPRLPTAADKAPSWVEASKFKPSSFRAMQGVHLAAPVRMLQNFISNFESLKSLQDLLIIHGPSGSGKSMLAYLYAQELAETMDMSPAQFGRWCLTINADEYDDVGFSSELLAKVSKFIEPKMDKASLVPFRLVILDNADSIGHSNQTTLKKFMDTNLLKLKWVFTVNSVKNLIGGFQTKGILVQTKAAAEKDALLIILNVLRMGKIGHERQGVQKIFDLHRAAGLSVSKMLDLAQRTFLLHHFVSEDNVVKAAGGVPEKRKITQLAVVGEEPLPRCRICTLHPPCAHISLDALLDKARKFRERLPQREGGVVCPTFSLTGRCEIFNKHGHCSLDHPSRLHDIISTRRVCPLCTILWPCNHCQYSVERDNLLRLVDILKARLALLKEINVPDPPAYLIRKLVDAYDDWRELIDGLARFYLTSEKNSVLVETQRWIGTAFSSAKRDYVERQQTLARAFGEILKSPLLVPTTINAAGRTRGTKDDASVGSGGSRGLTDLVTSLNVVN